MKRLALLVAVLAVMGCGQEPSHEYHPRLNLGGNVATPYQEYDVVSAFSEALACAPDQITFRLQENTVANPTIAGTVTATGTYIAPGCSSPLIGTTVHLIGEGCGRSGTAAIAISEDLSSVVIAYAVVDPGLPTACLAPVATSVTVLPGQTIQFYARLSFTCRVIYDPVLPASWPTNCP